MNERLDYYEMAQRKNAIRIEIDELRKTVLNLLIANHNDTVAVETAPRRLSTADLSFFVALGASLAIIVILGAIIVALIYHNRRLMLTSVDEAENDIEMANFTPRAPIDVVDVFEPEPEPELEPFESVDEEHAQEEEDEQPQPLFLIGSAAIHFSQRPSALAVVRGFELPAPIANPDSE